MKKVIVYYEDVYKEKTKAFDCYVINDHQLERLKAWFDGDSSTGSKPYPKYTIQEIE